MHLFAGAGGGVLSDILLQHVPVCAVEIDAYARSVLLSRQRDGLLPKFPIWDDIKTFDGGEWRGSVDIVAGGFPCQDISVAGKRSGIEGHRSGLWSEMARVICRVEPRFVFVENSAALTLRGLNRILWDLAAMGYDAEWGVLGANDCGGPHERERIWIAADSKGVKLFQLPKTPKSSNTERHRQSRQGQSFEPLHFKEGPFGEASGIVNALRQGSMPYVCRGHDGVASNMDRIRCLGNGQVSIVAATAWRILSHGNVTTD